MTCPPWNYAGLEHVDRLKIIHAHGRIYDPTLDWLLLADPFVQSAANAQSLNRFSSLLNNSLGETNLSGCCFDKLWDAVESFVVIILAVVSGVPL